MKTVSTNTATQKKNILRILLAVTLMLVIPLIAMQFTDEVDWSLSDFIVIGALLFGTGMIYEFGVKMLRTATQQITAAAILSAVLFLVWVELAVGVFGSLFAGS